MNRRLVLAALWLGLTATACGRTPVPALDALDAGPDGVGPEVCNGLDDDADLQVDEDFRDVLGRYLHDAHCGGCGLSCEGQVAAAELVRCGLVGDSPSCVAERCQDGFGPARSGGCTPLDRLMCLECSRDEDCGPLSAARCADIGGESRCSRSCEGGCPRGYVCVGAELCMPEGRSCSCGAGQGDFDLACAGHDPDAQTCAGSARCENGMLSSCELPPERCDGFDDDCDGAVDEDFIDELGVYGRDPQNCGVCGRDCTAASSSDAAPDFKLTCGGDPFVPSCVLECPDAADGVQVGDRLDADRRVDNGCECTVLALVDGVGALEGQDPSEAQIDVNCDGAEGEVRRSFYVAIDGDDSGPGSPTRPLRSLGEAVARAAASLTGELPRPDIYVATGTYTETLTMQNGVRLHGGYRRDFLSLDPDGFEVLVVAPTDTTAPFGAALQGDDLGSASTVVEALSLRGRDAPEGGAPAVAIYLRRPGPQLTLRGLRVRSGKPGAGVDGAAGAAGGAPASEASDGDPQRAAFEDAAHACVAVPENVALGGQGGENRCGGLEVSGGPGGSAGCPHFSADAGSGQDGRGGAAAPGGLGGLGGRDVQGPIFGGSVCDQSVCCGLADYTVPPNFRLPGTGLPGADGPGGEAGAACSDALGSFAGGVYRPGDAGAGSAGSAGGGGGGGGAGGGAEISFVAIDCEWPDGLGGGGGGGGAAGCGGGGGRAGSSGGPAIALLIEQSPLGTWPVLSALELITEAGGAGGDGGTGGDGGLGGHGGFGGRVADAERIIPPLAGPLPGERGGKGGDGGPGGGGGGGCGGASVGIWVVGAAADTPMLQRYREQNLFNLGQGGRGGRGGGGAVPADNGTTGARMDVVAR
ncbi:MAG: hypothetical protein OEZ06_24895 [Myxococcales bacterium]|nr:hypothetical protein [Myxococcales bacterium]